MNTLQGPPDESKEQHRAELRRQMAVQYEVELAMNALIPNMTNLVDKETEIAKSRNMEKHQLKNLLAVALETSSVEVVKNYILYQVGRDTPGVSWRYKDFGRKLVKRIDELKRRAEQITRKTHPDPKEPDPEQTAETWMLLTRAYLGQLNRYFYYRKEETRWPAETNR